MLPPYAGLIIYETSEYDLLKRPSTSVLWGTINGVPLTNYLLLILITSALASCYCGHPDGMHKGKGPSAKARLRGTSNTYSSPSRASFIDFHVLPNSVFGNGGRTDP